MFGTHIGLGDLRVVLHRQIAAHVAVPFVFKTLQAGLRPGVHIGIPGLAGAAHAEEGCGESVINRPLNARTFAGKRDLAERTIALPDAAVLREDERVTRLVRWQGNSGTRNAHLRHGTVNGKAGDVPHLADFKLIIIHAGAELRTLIVLAETEQFEPVTTAVFQRPRHEAQLLRIMIESLRGELADAPHLLGVGHGINDVSGAL